MKVSKQRRRQLEEMSPVLEENKSLQASVKDLQACLLQEHQQMEVESQSMAEQLSRSTDRQKGMSHNFALLVVSIVKCLPITCSTGDGARPFLGGLQPALGGEGESIGEGRENL